MCCYVVVVVGVDFILKSFTGRGELPSKQVCLDSAVNDVQLGWWSAERRTGEGGRHQWPRCLTSEGWASRCRRHGKIHQPNRRGWRPTDNRSHWPRRVAGPVRAPGTVSGGGAEVLWAAHQRGAGMGGVLPVLQRAPGAPPANRRSHPGEGTVLHPPAPGRNRSAADTQQR